MRMQFFFETKVFDDEDACSSPPCAQLPPQRTETLLHLARMKLGEDLEECVERMRSSCSFVILNGLL